MFSEKIPEVSTSLGLKSVLEKLKKEIRELQQKAEDDKMFKLEEVEIELSLGIKESANGGVSVWVINTGSEVRAESIHKIKLELKPMKSEDQDTDNTVDLPDKVRGSLNSSIRLAP